MIRTRNYSRKTTVSLAKRKRTAKRNSGARFLLKLLILLVLVGGVLAGGYFGSLKLYRVVSQARLSDWHVKSVVVNGVSGDLNKALFLLGSVHQNKPFTIKNAVQLREQILKKYPMLTDVSVKRGLFSGKLSISAHHRVPLAKFIRPDGDVLFIDKDSRVYQDPHPGLVAEVPSVVLEGSVPDKLSSEFIDLVESTLKLNKELNFTLLQMDMTHNTVRMRLPDGNEIDFGSAVQLKKKAARAAQIMALSRGKYKAPFVLRFTYFENGKVFLTQKGS